MIRQMDMREDLERDGKRSLDSKNRSQQMRQERALKASARSLEGPTALAGSR